MSFRKILASFIVVLCLGGNVFARTGSAPAQEVAARVEDSSQVFDTPTEKKLQAIIDYILASKDPELVAKLFDAMKVYDEVRVHYVDKKNAKEILDLAMKGMVSGLDPYSNLFIGPEAATMYKRLAGEEKYSGGIGISIGRYGKSIVILEVFDGFPASQAGMLAGDIILKVNDKSVYGMTTEEVVGLIKADVGKQVSMEIRSPNLQKPRVVNLTLTDIVIESVMERDLPDDVSYIKVRSFVLETPARFREALKNSEFKNGRIIDLRDNGGGSLNAVVEMVSYFVGPGKLVIIEKGRDGEEQVLTGPDSEMMKLQGKTVILVNNNSASASEIMSGTLQYYKAVTVMGVRTYGKATVQTYLDLEQRYHQPNPDTKLLMGITIAKYLLPDRTDITSAGVRPDIEVEQPENFRPYQYRTKDDAQLQAALDFLKKK